MFRLAIFLIFQTLFVSGCEDISDLADKDDKFTGINLLTGAQSEEIDLIVSGYLDDYKYISVAIIEGGQIRLTRSYGQDRIDRTDVYASVSKPVTSLILTQLLEEGYFHSFDDPVSDYSKKYKDVMPDQYKDTPLTFKHLLSHQGGVPHHDRIWKDGKLDLQFRPGTDVMYSTRGYGIIGEIMSEMTGSSYNHLVKEYIGDPVDANSFSVPNLLFEAPGGLVHSTISDMASFACGILDQTYVSDSLMMNQVWIPWADNEIGLGWYIRNHGTDSLSVYHAGSNGTPRAFLVIRPVQKLGVALLGKNVSSDGEQRFYSLARELMMRLQKFEF